jgi:L-fuconate dehydratase
MLQAKSLEVLQLDACRVGGVNENISILLLAAKFGIPVIPHAGGVGLCETVQHLSMYDFVSVSRTMEERMIEFADHLHEHFVTPASIVGGRYKTPTAPGSGAELLESSIDNWIFPEGSGWAEIEARGEGH